jgi:hypothetical protein
VLVGGAGAAADFFAAGADLGGFGLAGEGENVFEVERFAGRTGAPGDVELDGVETEFDEAAELGLVETDVGGFGVAEKGDAVLESGGGFFLDGH